MKITITKITAWEQDTQEMHGDASHEGYDNVIKLLAGEIVEKKDKEWKVGLPYVHEAASNDEDEAVCEALDAYTAEHCEYDYLKPTECDYDVWKPTCLNDCVVGEFFDDELIVEYAFNKYPEDIPDCSANPKADAYDILAKHGEIKEL